MGFSLVDKLKHAAWGTLAFLVAVGFVIGGFTWMVNNTDKFTQVVSSAGNFGATLTTTALDWGTQKLGGSAAEAAGPAGAAGPQVIMVQNTAPKGWHVGAAIRAWNRGLTTVRLKAGDCQRALPCIKVSQVSYLAPQDGHPVLGRTSFTHDSVKLNGGAVGHVPASSFPVAACHELGHALGAVHRTVRSSCMDAVIGAGVSARPERTDFATVNAKYEH